MPKAIDKRAYFRTIKYVPHPKQVLFHNSDARFRIPVCGRRFGKSVMAARDLEPQLFIPDRRFWIVGPTYDLGEKEFRVIWQDLIIDQRFGRDKRVRKAYNKKSGDMYIELPWRTRVEVRSATHPESLVGDSLDGVIMSEAAKQNMETWERYIRAALADRRGWATFPTTPEGQNWLYDLWLFGRNPEVAQYDSWRFPSWENPHVYPNGRNDDEIKLIELTTAKDWFDQEIGALFTAFVGKIFGEFDEMTHIKPHGYNPNYRNYITFDWGFVNPLAAIEFQVDSFDNIYIWREHYESYKTLPEHVDMLKARKNPAGYKIDGGFGDSEDPEACTYVSQHFTPILAMPEAKQNWRQGIDLIKRWLKLYPTGLDADEYGTPEEKPKLYVDPSCINTIKELSNYRTKDNLSKRVREHGRTAQAVSSNVDDHTVDALRYGMMHLFELGAKHHLEDVYRRTFDDTSHDTYFSMSSTGGVTQDMEF
jgi:hypothetical protein